MTEAILTVSLLFNAALLLLVWLNGESARRWEDVAKGQAQLLSSMVRAAHAVEDSR